MSVKYSNNKLVGLGGLEPPTSRLSGVRSNQLSYRPLQKSEDRGQKQYFRILFLIQPPVGPA